MKERLVIKPAEVSAGLIFLWLFRLDALAYISKAFSYLHWLILLAGVGTGLLACIKRKIKLKTIDAFIGVYCFLLLFSTVYNHIAVGECIRQILYTVSLVMCINLGITERNSNFLRFAFKVSFYLVLLHTLSALVFPNAMFADETGARTVFLLGPDNSSLRQYLLAIMFASMYCDTESKEKRYIYCEVFSFGIFSFVRDIATGKVCFLILLAGLLFRKNTLIKRLNGIFLMMVNGTFFLLLVVFQELSGLLSVVLPWLNRSATLTHRTTLWSFTLEKVMERPLLGYGYYGIEEFNKLLYYELKGMHNTGNPHNTYLTVLFSGGILLFAVFWLILWKSCKYVNRNKREPNGYLCCIVFFALLIHAQVEGRDMMYLIMAAKMMSVMGKRTITLRK